LLQADALQAASARVGQGEAVSYLQTVFVPETCFHLVDAPDLAAVTDLAARAGLADARIRDAPHLDSRRSLFARGSYGRAACRNERERSEGDRHHGYPANAAHEERMLESAPTGLTPVQLPTQGLLDQLAADGGLKPQTVFDNVGYGVIPTFKQGPPRFELPPGRMFSTSRFKALTHAYLKLNMNSEIEGNGGSCYGDSGSPKFIHGTNTVVAITFGGDPICRANNYNSRLDVPAAKAFYGQYLALP